MYGLFFYQLIMKKVVGMFLLIGLVACESSSVENTEQETNKENASQDTMVEKEVSSEINNEELTFDSELEFVKYSHQQLREKNQKTLENITDGSILFSAYAFIDTTSARKVTVSELTSDNDEVHYWGDYDARGDAIEMTNEAFLEKYVFSFDIEAENVVVNTYKGKPNAYGSELHNMHELYPEAKFVEFYHPPSEEGYMDWNALIFVVEQVNDKYILKAIIHNQWTA